MTDLADLTPRQCEVARLIGGGLSYAKVAGALGLSHRTVKCHVQAIATKLGNPDDLPAKMLVTVWAAHRTWEGSFLNKAA